MHCFEPPCYHDFIQLNESNWNAVQWSGMEWSRWNAVQWSWMEWSRWMLWMDAPDPKYPRKKRFLVFQPIRQFPFFESASFFFFLRGAFKNGLNKKACHKNNIFLKCVFIVVFKCFFVRVYWGLGHFWTTKSHFKISYLRAGFFGSFWSKN